MKMQVLPRDLEPGDKIPRVTKDLEVVFATVKAVEKVRRFKQTCYRVTLLELDEVPDNRRSWAEYRYLQPFILQPRQKVQIEREEKP